MVQFISKLLFAVSSVCVIVINAQNTSEPTFDELIANDTNLTALNTAVTSSNFSLSDAYEIPVTLFAPNNDAFTSDATLIGKYVAPQYIAHLQNILLMHVVEEQVLSTELSDGQVVPAANMETINVTIGGDGTVVLNTADSNATVVTTDILSSDGVIHRIDGFLLPSFVNVGLLDLTKNVEGFDIILELLTLTGLSNFVGPDVEATVFAPTDAAFMELPEGALDYYRKNSGILTLLLSGHVVTEIIPTQNMKNGDVYLGPMDTTLTIRIEEVEGNTLYYVNNATIIEKDRLANNGIIHAIASVLEVPGAEYPPKVTAPTAPTTPTAPTAPVTAPTPTSSSTNFMTYGIYTVTAILGYFMMA